MGVSEEQRAMMRLLARGNSHEDIAALMGVSVEEVQAKVDAALAQMENDGEPAKSAEPVQTPPPAPQPPPRRRAPRPRPQIKLPKPDVPPERRRFVVFAGAALVVVAVVILLVFLIGGAGDSGSSTAEGGGSETALAANVTKAQLEPVGGSEASGEAIFGKIEKTAVLQVQAEGLAPSPQGTSYAIWLYTSPKAALRVGATQVKDEGLGVQLPLPQQLLTILAAGVFQKVNVTLTDDAEYRAEVKRAKAKKHLPRYTGETVLSGTITGSLVEQDGRGAAQGQGE